MSQYKVISISNPGTSTLFGSDDLDSVTKTLNGNIGGLPPVKIKNSNKWGFWDGIMYIRNQADTHNVTIRGPSTDAGLDYDVELPHSTGNDILAGLNTVNEFTVSQLFDLGITMAESVTTPADPSGGTQIFFVDTDGHFKKKDSGGSVTDYDVVAGGVPLYFPDDTLKLRNPADTFNYTFSTSAITSNLVITVPLLTANDELLFKSNPATISGKIFDSSNTISSLSSLPTISIAKGGTGQTTQTLAFNALSPLTTLGDLTYHNGTNVVRLAGNVVNTKRFLRQTGTGAVSAAPAWDTVDTTDLPASVVFDTESNVITDTMINTHTTTKISTTNKSLLNSSIVYIDQANSFGNFDQSFGDNRVRLWNPASTFRYTITAGAISANRILNVPVITGTDTLAVLSFAQTFSNHIFDATCSVNVAALPASVILDTESNQITDTLMNTHTTTKISTTSKSLLNSSIVYIDQTNSFGDFAQIFKDNQLKINNPADTFSYILTAGAILADRILNIPVITGTDTLSTLGLAQTITGAKTFNDQILKMRNPADTFSYTFASAAIAQDTTVNMPAITTTTPITLVSRSSVDILTFKTIELDNNTVKHSATNTAGDLIKNTGTKFDRFARGTASQLLRVNAGATDIEWFTFTSGDLPSHTHTKAQITDFLHAASHKTGGGDSIKLDEFAAPTDVTTLNSTLTEHGLLPKLGGGSTNFLRADGTWSAPPGAGGGEANTASNVGTGQGVFKAKVGIDLTFRSITATSTKIALANNANDVGIDVTPANIALDTLGAPTDITTLNASTSAHGLMMKYPGGTTNFLREDGTWQATAGGGAHKANHVSGGSDAFVKGDDLVAAAMYLQDIADPASDSQRIWMVDASNLIKYWSDEASPVKHTVAVLGLAQTYSELQTVSKDTATLFQLYRPSNTVTNGVEFDLQLQDSAANQTSYAKIRSVIVTNTDGVEEGALRLQNRVGGTLTTCLEINQVGLTQLESGVAFGSVISPAQLTANTNDWNPTGLQGASIIRVNTDSSFRMLTGITAPVPETNKVIFLRNISANTLLLRNQSTASSAANRFDFNGYDIPLFPKKEMRLLYDVTLDRWTCENAYGHVIPPAGCGYYYRNDMFGITGDPTVSSLVSGTAAANSVTAITSVAGHPGVVQSGTGSTSSGNAAMGTANYATILLGNSWYWVYEAMVRIPTLSDGTNRYGLDLGFIDTINAGAPVDALYAFYQDNLNSGNWILDAENNDTITSGNSSSAVAAATWYKVKVVQYPDGTGELFVNGVSVTTIASGMPSGAGRGTGFGTQLFKLVGSTSRTLDIDYIEVIGYSNTP